MSKKKGKQKPKVTYYDDNSTVADMSPVDKAKEKPYNRNRPPKRQSTAKEKWKTYWAAVKMMFIPMIIVLAVIGILFLIWRLAF